MKTKMTLVLCLLTMTTFANMDVSYHTNVAATGPGDPGGSGYRVFVTKTVTTGMNTSSTTAVTNWFVPDVQRSYPTGPTTKFSDPTDKTWYQAPPQDSVARFNQYQPQTSYGYSGVYNYRPYYGGYGVTPWNALGPYGRGRVLNSYGYGGYYGRPHLGGRVSIGFGF